MTFHKTELVEEIHDVFERIHARLDARCQQLIRQVNSHTNHFYRKSNSNSSITCRIIANVSLVRR